MRVVVLGGGVAGLSAAMELLERRFEVDVYEALDVPGGKARSVTIERPPQTGLPGEHGLGSVEPEAHAKPAVQLRHSLAAVRSVALP